MPLVIIQAPPLSAAQKKRIGDRVIESLHGEGVPASSVVVLFQPDTSDIFLDGGLVYELSGPAPLATRPALEPAAKLPAGPLPPEEDYKGKARRTKQDLLDLRNRLVSLLEAQGGLSSFKAQEDLGLKDCDWASATLRRLFGELEEEGLIAKQGQKRGTRYVWKGSAGHVPTTPGPRLVKRAAADGDANPGAPDSE